MFYVYYILFTQFTKFPQYTIQLIFDSNYRKICGKHKEIKVINTKTNANIYNTCVTQDMVINKKEHVAEENLQELALLHSKALFSKTDVCVYSDN